MAFLFKSKKQQEGGLPKATRNITSADGYIQSDPLLGPPPPIGSAGPMNARGISSPTPPGERTLPPRAESELGHHNPRMAPPRPNADNSLYPWSQRRLDFPSPGQNPFPRYGAATNSVASKDGDVYIMGGLINGSMVKGDLWIVETGKGGLSCVPVPTTAEGPGPRVGHASLLVGNAYIVFGGDTKVDEMDVLDDTLYLLNTSTKHWSRALPAGPRPSGRYGHTLNILGSKIFIFGGQVEGFFFNDLVAFDLNQLQSPSNQWEILMRNSAEGGPPVGSVPPARTNHTIITYQEKLYLFGGTDGNVWYNDVWVYDSERNSWSLQECIGFIPCPREGHAAALVGDVMYVFGGRTEEGKDLGDLAAYRIPTRRWYTFQNMGPAPSPRSGHGMTACGNKILVLAGEPSSAPRDPAELSLAYVLDTSKIRYPSHNIAPPQTQPPASPPAPLQLQQNGTMSRQPPNGADAPRGPSLEQRAESRQMEEPTVNGELQRYGSKTQLRDDPLRRPNGPLQAQPPANPAQPQLPTQLQPMQQAPNGPAKAGYAAQAPVVREAERDPRLNQRLDRAEPIDRPSVESLQKSQWANAASPPPGSRDLSTQQTAPQQQAPYAAAGAYAAGQVADKVARSNSVQQQQPRSGSAAGRRQDTMDSANTDVFVTPTEDATKTSQMPGGFPVDSGVGSSPAMTHQIPALEEMQRELEAMRSRNAWYHSELALARKAGYRSSLQDAVSNEDKASISDDDRPLLEALLKMRNELVSVQEAFAAQSKMVAQRVAQAERERDAAVSEAVQAKTRAMARQRGGGGSFESQRDSDEVSRRLASTLAAHHELNVKHEALAREVRAEREARQLAEESAHHAHSRASELDQNMQEHSSEIEHLRSELHEAQKNAREEAAACAEALAASKMLRIDHEELKRKHSVSKESSKNHTGVLASLHEAVKASSDKSEVLERRLEAERRSRAAAEEKLIKLRAEHEAHSGELESVTRKLQEAEELAASHRSEAEKHRAVVLAGLGSSAGASDHDSSINDERIVLLQQQLETANNLVRQNQAAADSASEKLRRAEERIAGLESYQEQTSREGLGMRKQLQQASQTTAGLHAEKAELQSKVTNHAMDLAALQVQHDAVKNLLHERGIDTSNLQTNQADHLEHFRELEAELDATRQANDDLRMSYEQREQEASRGWEEKLAALDNDYQSAVKYLKGTEKMLSKLKTELQRYKTQNKELEERLAGERGTPSPATWENERATLRHELDEMSARVQASSNDLERQMEAVHAANTERDQLQKQLAAARDQVRDADTLRSRNVELEQRAVEAERKAHMLLETVGTTVNNYRRESQQVQANGSLGSHAPGATSAAASHNRGPSVNSLAESSYSSEPHGEDMLSRNSMALDQLAGELETLRTHWESTSKTYRRSDASDLEKTPSAEPPHNGAPGLSGSLASWRKKLDSREHESGRSSVDDKI